MTTTHPKTIAKLARCQVPETQTQTDGPQEAKTILYIGGPKVLHRRADRGQTQQVIDGDLYRRVILDVGNKLTRFELAVMAHVGPEGTETV